MGRDTSNLSLNRGQTQGFYYYSQKLDAKSQWANTYAMSHEDSNLYFFFFLWSKNFINPKGMVGKWMMSLLMSWDVFEDSVVVLMLNIG